MWRLASFLAGLPLGALAAHALRPDPWPLSLQVGAVAGGVLLALATVLVTRWSGGERERGRHVAAAASLAWLALPALAAAWLGLRPGAPVWLGGVLLLVAYGFWRASRIEGPAQRSGSAPAVALGAAAGGALLAALLGALLAVLGATTPAHTERSAAYIWDLDARIVTRPLPRCAPRVASQRVLLGRGAHPRLGPEGRFVWFDAAGPEGRRQIHRLDRESGETLCWTCGEPGNNQRPAVAANGRGLVFDSDRHADLRHPANTEIYLSSAGGVGERPSRRLTFSAEPDDHAIFDPGGRLLVWSRGRAGGFEVVTASVQSGHGGIVLGAPRVLASGRARWIAPLAWSPDAHALAVARGHPLRPAVASAIDFATGEEWSLGNDLGPAGSVAFSADGGWMVTAGTRRASSLGLVPGSLGFLVGRLAAAGATPAFRGSAVRSGANRGDKQALEGVELGELGGWGGATGIGLAPDGRGFVLGQHRGSSDGVEERLVEVRLECEDVDVASQD